MNIPIIRLEVSGMKHVVQVALTEYTEQMDKDIQRALDLAITPDTVRAIISEEVDKEVKRGLQELVQSSIRRIFWDENLKKEIADAIGDRVKVVLKKNEWE